MICCCFCFGDLLIWLLRIVLLLSLLFSLVFLFCIFRFWIWLIVWLLLLGFVSLRSLWVCFALLLVALDGCLVVVIGRFADGWMLICFGWLLVYCWEILVCVYLWCKLRVCAYNCLYWLFVCAFVFLVVLCWLCFGLFCFWLIFLIGQLMRVWLFDVWLFCCWSGLWLFGVTVCYSFVWFLFCMIVVSYYIVCGFRCWLLVFSWFTWCFLFVVFMLIMCSGVMVCLLLGLMLPSMLLLIVLAFVLVVFMWLYLFI